MGANRLDAAKNIQYQPLNIGEAWKRQAVDPSAAALLKAKKLKAEDVTQRVVKFYAKDRQLLGPWVLGIPWVSQGYPVAHHCAIVYLVYLASRRAEDCPHSQALDPIWKAAEKDWKAAKHDAKLSWQQKECYTTETWQITTASLVPRCSKSWDQVGNV
eukprot:Skav228622  [mRNA]  locus=scaffold2037:362299:363460:+ [translate_table: standard]